MKKRLRKKLHRGEFQEFGFSIAWQFSRPLNAQSNAMFYDALIEMIGARGLTFGGGGDEEQGSGFICKAGRGSTSDEDSSHVAEWFQGLHPSVAVAAGPREDAWNSSPPQVVSVQDWVGRGGDVIVMPPVRE